MVAVAAAATQTLGSGGRAPRPEVTFQAASARATPPSLFHPPSGLHPVLAALGRRARDPLAAGPPALWCETALREPLPGASRMRVLRPRSMAPRAEGLRPRPLLGPEPRARPVRRRLPVSGEVPPTPGTGTRACAVRPPRRLWVGGMRRAARAARATPGPPVVSIIVTLSLPSLLASDPRPRAGGVCNLRPWSFRYPTERVGHRRRPMSMSISASVSPLLEY